MWEDIATFNTNPSDTVEKSCGVSRGYYSKTKHLTQVQGEYDGALQMFRLDDHHQGWSRREGKVQSPEYVP